jgi:hypothetical protein
MSAVFTVYKLQPISDEMDSRPYIGVTGNYRMRIHFHRYDYKRFPNRPVYASMRANGGFENYHSLIVQQFLESEYEEGVAMRLAGDLEAKLVRQLIPLKGCLNTEIPGRSARDWRAEKKAADPVGFSAAHRCAVAAWRAKKMSADPDGYRDARRCALAAWRAKNKAAKLAAASD